MTMDGHYYTEEASFLEDEDIVYGPFPTKLSSSPSMPVVEPLEIVLFLGTVSSVTMQSKFEEWLMYTTMYLDSQLSHFDLVQDMWQSLMQHPSTATASSIEYCIQLPYPIRLDASGQRHSKSHMRISQREGYIDPVGIYPAGQYSGMLFLKLTDATMHWSHSYLAHEARPKAAGQPYHIEFMLKNLRCISLTNDDDQDSRLNLVDTAFSFHFCSSALAPMWESFKHAFHLT